MSDYAPSTVIYFKFGTFLNAVPTTLSGSPVVSAYKDNSLTQTTTGVTLTVDFDSITGCNQVAVDTSTDGTFYSAGSIFQLVVTTGTVGGNSLVGFVIDAFTLNKVSALRPTVAARTLDVSTGGEAGMDWANVGSPTTTLNLSGTTIAITQRVDVNTIKTNAVVNGGTVTFPTGATLASTTNITAGTIATVSGNVTGSVGSISGVTFPSNFGALGIGVGGEISVVATVAGNVNGSVGSITGVTFPANFDALAISGGGIVSADIPSVTAQLVKVLAAVYDSATLSGSTLTLSNAATMVVTSTGRATT